MNPLQSGTPASNLSPQNYKNSSQTGTVQGTISGSNVQQSNDDLLQTEITGKLKVVTGNSTNEVLGVATENSAVVKTNSSGVPMFAVLLLVISVVGAVYYFRKYLSFPRILEVPEEDEE